MTSHKQLMLANVLGALIIIAIVYGLLELLSLLFQAFR